MNLFRQRLLYYLAFLFAFGAMWFLFKLGGIPVFHQAFFSAGIDILICLGALLVISEGLIPIFYFRKKYSLFSLAFFLTIIVCGSLMIVAQLNQMGYSLSGYPALLKKYKEHFFYWFWSDLVLGSYFLVGFIAAVGFAIRVAIERLAISRTLSRLENENLHSQLENLTRQINPHFLFNALNNIYYKIDSSNVAAREMVDHFASMLRYQLYDCNESQVPIEMELKLIENFVALQRSRLTPGITIECEGFDDIKGFTISPFLLLPVVENCFKHLAVPGPNTVEIDCKYENSNFIFHTSNSYDVNPLSKEISAGIGLSNIRKRLELTYNGNSKFTAEKKGDRFDTILQIEIDGYQMHNH